MQTKFKRRLNSKKKIEGVKHCSRRLDIANEGGQARKISEKVKLKLKVNLTRGRDNCRSENMILQF